MQFGGKVFIIGVGKNEQVVRIRLDSNVFSGA